MADKQKYEALLTEIIAKQADVLGPDIAIAKARNVADLEVSNDGKVTGISGDPALILQQLINEYVALSGQIVNNILGPVFDKYPEINVTIKK